MMRSSTCQYLQEEATGCSFWRNFCGNFWRNFCGNFWRNFHRNFHGS